MSTSFGIAVPNTYMGDGVGEEHFGEYAQTVERLGFQSAWVLERTLHPERPMLETMTLLGYLAAKTRSVRIGSSVILFPLRNPLIFAKAAATLDYLSRGRLTLGIALGSMKAEYEASGIPWERRLKRFNSGLGVMKALWTGELVNYEGEIGRIQAGRQLPTPVQKPHPKLLFGGSADGVLRRAAKNADGWIGGGGLDPAAFKEHVVRLKTYLAANDRTPEQFEIVKLIHIHVENDEDRAKAILTGELLRYYGRPFDVEARSAYGRPETCAQRLRTLIEAGARHFVLVPVVPDLEQPARISAEILPALVQR